MCFELFSFYNIDTVHACSASSVWFRTQTSKYTDSRKQSGKESQAITTRERKKIQHPLEQANKIKRASAAQDMSSAKRKKCKTTEKYSSDESSTGPDEKSERDSSPTHVPPASTKSKSSASSVGGKSTPSKRAGSKCGSAKMEPPKNKEVIVATTGNERLHFQQTKQIKADIQGQHDRLDSEKARASTAWENLTDECQTEMPEPVHDLIGRINGHQEKLQQLKRKVDPVKSGSLEQHLEYFAKLETGADGIVNEVDDYVECANDFT